MSAIDLKGLNQAAANKIKPFLDEILAGYQDKLHSIHITGTAVTEDFDEKSSNVNSVFVLKKMNLKFLELLAPLGKKYSKQNVAAPLIMTPEYIDSSLDVFPIEFLSFRLVHSTVFGKDILKDLEIDMTDLRHQCERDLKVKLIWLRQGYLFSLGDRKTLTEGFVSSISGYIPLFRGIILLLGKEPPARHLDVIKELAEATSISTDVFERVLTKKHERKKLSLDELNTIFEDYYAATEKLGRLVDEIR